jgi:hypothetical protein
VATISFVQGDTNPSIFGNLTNDDGSPYDLTDTTVRFQMRETLDRRFAVDASAVIVGDPTLGAVRYDWQAGDLVAAGDYESRWRILFLDSGVEHTIPANSITVEAQ